MARLWLAALVAAAALALTVSPGGPQPPLAAARGTRCPGTFRWPVKTMTDPSARGSWVLARPTTTTIHALVHRTDRLRHLRASTPRQRGAERTIFRVQARLVAAEATDSSSSAGDGDIRLVLADPRTGETMMAAFPDPNCAPASRSSQRAQMARARVFFIARCQFPPLGRFAPLHGTATVTGVGFYSDERRTHRAAPNGIELHPVLAFGGAGCTR